MGPDAWALRIPLSAVRPLLEGTVETKLLGAELLTPDVPMVEMLDPDPERTVNPASALPTTGGTKSIKVDIGVPGGKLPEPGGR